MREMDNGPMKNTTHNTHLGTTPIIATTNNANTHETTHTKTNTTSQTTYNENNNQHTSPYTINETPTIRFK